MTLQFSSRQADPLLGMTGPGSLCAAHCWCQKSEQGSQAPPQWKSAALMALAAADRSFMASSCEDGDWAPQLHTGHTPL